MQTYNIFNSHIGMEFAHDSIILIIARGAHYTQELECGNHTKGFSIIKCSESWLPVNFHFLQLSTSLEEDRMFLLSSTPFRTFCLLRFHSVSLCDLMVGINSNHYSLQLALVRKHQQMKSEAAVWVPRQRQQMMMAHGSNSLSVPLTPSKNFSFCSMRI